MPKADFGAVLSLCKFAHANIASRTGFACFCRCFNRSAAFSSTRLSSILKSRSQYPVRHSLTAETDTHPLQFLLLPVKGRRHHKFLCHDMSDGLRSGKASRNDVFLTRSLNYRRFNIVFLAVPAGIGIVDVFFYYRLRRNDFPCRFRSWFHRIWGRSAARPPGACRAARNRYPPITALLSCPGVCRRIETGHWRTGPA